ncbi:ABC transporter permease [Ureibacillus sp. FSL K6-8385]|uniref:ABC transporter permease n=1 Tax=Ureibacillus terrenus TaxID=118246 RepID=A0A540V701_9BACL|nr:ABC transporter permease [Ureibacillus terrenus]MED3660482.1 ABC transporter permease [Ureibacillus terrenus]MED3762636.1 ABC transporter permease [Ureibacillus terrenus]TQE92485.1 ABC transporter permease [Ureibacillus terrenus]
MADVKKKMNVGLLLSVATIACLFLAAIFAHWLAPYDPNAGELSERLLPPSKEHWFGTDHLGRDVFSRILFGARTTFLVAILITVGCFVIGTAAGVTAGYFGGWIDGMIMRAVDLLSAFPGRILALVIVGIIGPGLMNLAIAMIFTSWVGFARIVRGVTLSVREREFVLAAKLYGLGNQKIMYKHLLPNVLPQLLVVIALNTSWYMTALSGFSLLGLGIEAPHAEWGMMISEARPYMRDYGYLLFFPSMAIMIAVTAFTILGEKLRDRFDPNFHR